MEIETLKKSHLKRNIIIGVVGVAIISAIILNFSSARYRVTDSIEIVNGEVNYIPYDFKMIAMYQENDSGSYDEVNIMPSASSYTINTQESYCNVNGTKDNNAVLETIDGHHTIANLQKGSKCYLYFDEKLSAEETILPSKNIDSSRSGAITGTLTTDTTGTVYSVQDDWGTSYVYAGAPTDNWVSFAGYYWRIIRINGDGSIRMIYNGTTTDQTGTGTQIQKSAYNSSSTDNAHVGYMYGSTGQSNYANTHRNTNDSTIKGILDEWYEENIVRLNLTSYVSTEAGFCNDRQPQSGVMSGYGTLGYGTNRTGYAPWGRLYQSGSWKSSQTPSLRCTNTNDLFTVSGSSKGNHALTYPIGLITSDEVVLAGGFGGSDNTSYYLYTNQFYWTMSPYHFNANGYAYVFFVASSGHLYAGDFAGRAQGVRPVINLSADVTISGSGTASDPYTVVA